MGVIFKLLAYLFHGEKVSWYYKALTNYNYYKMFVFVFQFYDLYKKVSRLGGNV